LKQQYDELLSNFAFSFNLRRYRKDGRVFPARMQMAPLHCDTRGRLYLVVMTRIKPKPEARRRPRLSGETHKEYCEDERDAAAGKPGKAGQSGNGGGDSAKRMKSGHGLQNTKVTDGHGGHLNGISGLAGGRGHAESPFKCSFTTPPHSPFKGIHNAPSVRGQPTNGERRHQRLGQPTV